MPEMPEHYGAIVLADSIASGVRLTTLCVNYPRIVLAETNTHRVFSRNTASSRAIPVKRRIEMVQRDPFIPLSFGKNRRGMQATEDLGGDDANAAREAWLCARDKAVVEASRLADIGVHKQLANRILEPFTWVTQIISATEWDNFWALRISEHAQPEIRKVAENMKAAMVASTPRELAPGEWHLPLAHGHVWADEDGCCVACGVGCLELASAEPCEEVPIETLVKLSTSRCAAISYERHMDHVIDKDLARYEKLHGAGHMSPFEHAAMVGYPAHRDGFGTYTDHPQPEDISAEELLRARYFGADFIGNFRAPWIQHRKQLPGEAVFGSANG